MSSQPSRASIPSRSCGNSFGWLWHSVQNRTTRSGRSRHVTFFRRQIKLGWGERRLNPLSKNWWTEEPPRLTRLCQSCQTTFPIGLPHRSRRESRDDFASWRRKLPALRSSSIAIRDSCALERLLYPIFTELCSQKVEGEVEFDVA